MIDDDVTHNGTADEFGVNVGFTHAWGDASANLSMTRGEQFRRMFELLGVRGIGGEPSLDIPGVVGVKLALNDDFG